MMLNHDLAETKTDLPVDTWRLKIVLPTCMDNHGYPVEIRSSLSRVKTLNWCRTSWPGPRMLAWK